MSGGVVVEAILGPAFLGGSASLTSSDWRLYVSLAPFQR
jgi:hypothetical protein